MRPEIAKIIEEDSRVLLVGPIDSEGGLWADYDRAKNDRFRVSGFQGLPRWIRYRTGQRGTRTMLLLDYLLWGIDGEYAEKKSGDAS